MTLRGVIQGLMRGTDDDGSGLSGSDDGGSSNVEAMLAEHGFGDLPAEMFGQALASYADTASMAEADALTPVLTTLDAGDPSDVYAVLEEQPIAPVPPSAVPDAAIDVPIAGVGAAGAAFAEVDDDIPDGFGQSIGSEDAVGDDTPSDDTDDLDDRFDDTDGFDDADLPSAEGASTEVDDPFGDSVDDHLGDTESFVEMFETGPEATGEDPSDLDLDFDG